MWTPPRRHRSNLHVVSNSRAHAPLDPWSQKHYATESATRTLRGQASAREMFLATLLNLNEDAFSDADALDQGPNQKQTRPHAYAGVLQHWVGCRRPWCTVLQTPTCQDTVHTSRPEPVAWLLMRTTEFTGPLNIRPKRTRFQKPAGNHIPSRQCHGPIPHRTTPHGHMSPSHVLETGYMRTSRSPPASQCFHHAVP